MKKITRSNYTASGLGVLIDCTKRMLADQGFKVIKVEVYNSKGKWWDFLDLDRDLVADIYYEEDTPYE